MSIHKTLATGMVAIAISAGAASAATYDLTQQSSSTLFSFEQPVLTGMKLNETVTYSQVGGYAIDAQEVGSSETWSFVGWCIDLFTSFNHGASESDVIGRYDASSDQPSTLHAEGRLDTVESFFDRLYDPTIVTDKFEAAGWQLAIWELLYETSGSYSLSSGAFQAIEEPGWSEKLDTTLTDEQKAWDAANAYLTDFSTWIEGSPETDWTFTWFTAQSGLKDNQALVTVTPPSEVPLPAPALLLLGGLAALGAMRRRA